MEPSGLEPALPAWDVALIAARWRMGKLELAELEDFAVQALMRGNEGPALGELAWRHESWREIEGLFERALAEIGAPVPTPLEALRVVRRDLARRTLSGEMELESGAFWIVRLDCAAHYSGNTDPDFDWDHLDRLLGELDYPTGDVAQLEAELKSILWNVANGPVLGAEKPPSGLAPALGGDRSGSMPAPEPEPPPDAAWRFAFHFNFDVTLRRFFPWGGPPR